MIPKETVDYNLVLDKYPSYTYKLNLEDNNIFGYVDDKKALEQSIYKYLSTDRYKYLIYSFDYGIEIEDLIGESIDYCIIDLPRRIKECLSQDDRIISVDNFKFEIIDKGELACTFIVNSIFGTVDISKTFNFERG